MKMRILFEKESIRPAASYLAALSFALVCGTSLVGSGQTDPAGSADNPATGDPQEKDPTGTAMKLGKTPEAQISWKGENYQVVMVDLARQRIRLVWQDESGQNYGSLGKVEKLIDSESPGRFVLATNAGMFRPDFSPVGLHIVGGRELRKLDPRTRLPGNFYMEPNGVFFVDSDNRAGVLETGRFDKAYPRESYPDKIELATQSGPMLVVEGDIHPAFREGSKSRYVRSGVGVLGGGTVVFAISVRPVNFHTFASLFRDFFNCENALYLDGAISRFHAPGKGIVNTGGNFGGILAVEKLKRE